MTAKPSVVRRVRVPDLEPGYDDQVDPVDRPLVKEVITLLFEMAHFKQPKEVPEAPIAATAPEVSLLRPFSFFQNNPAAASSSSRGAYTLNDFNMENDMDVDDSDDVEPQGGRLSERANATVYDDVVDYAVIHCPEMQCYIINALMPRDAIFTVSRCNVICSLSIALILTESISFHSDLQTGRPVFNIRVNKRSDPRTLLTRMHLIEQIGVGPAVRVNGGGSGNGNGFSLADGVSVRRTADGTVINAHVNSRPTKRARHNTDS